MKNIPIKLNNFSKINSKCISQAVSSIDHKLTINTFDKIYDPIRTQINNLTINQINNFIYERQKYKTL